MGHAIALKSINDSAKQIESLWDTCSVLERKPSMRALNYPPHISMAVCEGLPEDDLFEAIDSVSTRFRQFEINFNELNTFENESNIVLWTKPKEQENLKRLHVEIHRFIDPEHCEFYYRPENWIAHCTLATDIDVSKRDAVNEFIKGHDKSIKVIFNVIDCVSFFPIEVRREKELKGNC